MGLTVGIKCYRDYRVFRCLASIPSPVETLVVLSPGDPIQRDLEAAGIKVVVVQDNDLGARCNAAIEVAKNDRILLVDSDCILAEGCAEEIDAALSVAMVVRARLRLLDDGSAASRSIARWREYENNTEPVPAFTPGLGIHRRLLGVVTPPLFPVGLRFSEDDALNTRLKEKGIQPAFVPNACVVHDAVTWSHFLETGRRTGEGTWRQVHAGIRPNFEEPANMLANLIKLRWLGTVAKWLSGTGLMGTAAGIAWHLAYYNGFYSARAKDPRRTTC